MQHGWKNNLKKKIVGKSGWWPLWVELSPLKKDVWKSLHAVPQNVTLFGIRVIADVFRYVKMKSY